MLQVIQYVNHFSVYLYSILFLRKKKVLFHLFSFARICKMIHEKTGSLFSDKPNDTAPLRCVGAAVNVQ